MTVNKAFTENNHVYTLSDSKIARYSSDWETINVECRITCAGFLDRLYIYNDALLSVFSQSLVKLNTYPVAAACTKMAVSDKYLILASSTIYCYSTKFTLLSELEIIAVSVDFVGDLLCLQTRHSLTLYQLPAFKMLKSYKIDSIGYVIPLPLSHCMFISESKVYLVGPKGLDHFATISEPNSHALEISSHIVNHVDNNVLIASTNGQVVQLNISPSYEIDVVHIGQRQFPISAIASFTNRGRVYLALFGNGCNGEIVIVILI